MSVTDVTKDQCVSFRSQLQDNSWSLKDALKVGAATSTTLANNQTILQRARHHGQPWQAEPMLRGLPRSTRHDECIKTTSSITNILAASTSAEALWVLQVLWIVFMHRCS